MRAPVYIAGPYRGEPAEVELNVRRACALAHHAVRMGRTPYVPHAHGFLEVFGLDGAGAGATDELALECCESMIWHLGLIEGAELWVILRNDGTPSEGTRRELGAWDGAAPTCRTWAEWQRVIHAGREGS